MPNQLSIFEKLDGIAGVYAAQTEKLRCLAIALRDGSVCLFNPVAGLNAEARKSLERIGEITFLVSPNHYHNRGLGEYAHEFPDARVVASERAVPRLRKITRLDIESIEPLASALPARLDVLYPQGLKTGEIWVRAKTGRGSWWFVGDAFCTTKSNTTQTIADSPELLGTFPRFGVADGAEYRQWVERQIAEDRPKTIVPCHGRVVRSKDLPNKLREVMRSFH